VMLDFPVVVVARTSVGTINHTLMTVEALRHRPLHVAGVVMVGNPDADARDAIEH
jgi:dethiobiotin synthetase